MTKRDWSNIWRLFKDVVKYERKTVINCVVAALLSAIKPYIFVILLGMIIDMVYAGADWQTLVKDIVVMISCKFLLDIVLARSSESFWQKLRKLAPLKRCSNSSPVGACSHQRTLRNSKTLLYRIVGNHLPALLRFS